MLQAKIQLMGEHVVFTTSNSVYLSFIIKKKNIGLYKVGKFLWLCWLIDILDNYLCDNSSALIGQNSVLWSWD